MIPGSERNWIAVNAVQQSSLNTKRQNMTTLYVKKSMARSPLRLGLFLAALTLVCFAIPDRAQAVNPPPDGGYPGFTTAEGTKALQSLTTGSANTAVGWYSLFSNAASSFTPLPAQEHSFSITETLPLGRHHRTPRLARRRFYSTPLAPTTQPLARSPYYTTSTVPATQQLVRALFRAIPAAARTRQLELVPSLPTRLAA